MSSRLGDGPAFPTQYEALDPRATGWTMESGMSVRTYIATAVLQGMNASLSGTCDWPDAKGRARMACEARFQADALIAELEKS